MQQREGIWTDEQILVLGENGHQVGKDLPLPYGVITCRFAANWQRMPAYGIGSSPACVLGFCCLHRVLRFSLIIQSLILLPLFVCHIPPLLALLTSFFLSQTNPFL